MNFKLKIEKWKMKNENNNLKFSIYNLQFTMERSDYE